jgi:ceramide glucosyltransferase
LTGDDRISLNPKLNNLVKGWAAASHDWVVMADTNLILPPTYLAELFARWLSGTGLVCSPPVGGRPMGFGAEIECAFLNTCQARWQLAADAVGLGFAQGKTMLWRKDVLDAAGGIRALAAEPAEDAAATKVVRRAGLKVRLAPGPFMQPLGRRHFAEVWRRQVRWARLRRVTFKAFFLPELLIGSFFPLAVATGLAAAGLVPATTPLLLAGIWYGAEALLARAAGWHLSLVTPAAWLIRDALLPVLWVAAWVGNGFVWRGNAMTVETPIARLAASVESGEAPTVLASALARWRSRRSRYG